MQIKVGDLVRHKYMPHYGTGLAVSVGDYWIQVKWLWQSKKGAIMSRSQRVENLARVK